MQALLLGKSGSSAWWQMPRDPVVNVFSKGGDFLFLRQGDGLPCVSGLFSVSSGIHFWYARPVWWQDLYFATDTKKPAKAGSPTHPDMS